MLARRKRNEGRRNEGRGHFVRMVIGFVSQLKTANLSPLDEAVAASSEEGRFRMPDPSGTLFAIHLPEDLRRGCRRPHYPSGGDQK